MKRITKILVLLGAVLLVSTTMTPTSAQAGGADYLPAPDPSTKTECLETGTYAAPPDGDGSEGDPDSMGDGLSKDLDDPTGGPCGSGWPDEADSFPSIAEYLLYVLSQIQVLMI